jgi:hypothetical protein
MNNIEAENLEGDRVSFFVNGHSFHLKVANTEKAKISFAYLNSLLNERLSKQPGLSLLEALFVVSMSLIQEEHERVRIEQVKSFSCDVKPEETIQGLLNLLVEANEKFKKDSRIN